MVVLVAGDCSGGGIVAGCIRTGVLLLLWLFLLLLLLLLLLVVVVVVLLLLQLMVTMMMAPILKPGNMVKDVHT